jgi:hypothetical protein
MNLIRNVGILTLLRGGSLFVLLSTVWQGFFLQNTQAAAGVVLWDTSTPGATVFNVEDRNNWKPVPSDLLTLEANPPKASSDPGYYGREYSFKGDAVVENQRMLAVFWSAKGRVAIYSNTDGGSSQGAPAFGKMLELAPIQSKTNPTTLGHIEILRHTEDDVVLQVAFGGSPEVSAVLSFGTSEIIDVKPSAAMNGISLMGSFEYGIVPGFIGDDLIFGPETANSGSSLCLPAENFFLGLLKGESGELVMTWPKGKQQIRLGLGGEQDGRHSIQSIDFEDDGQAFYLAPLGAPGIWHKEVLTPAFLEKDVAISWKKPFPARWKTQLYEEALKTTYAFRESKGDIWRGVPGSYDYPVWFEGEQTFYHLSKKVPPKGESVVYFLEGQGTPTSISTPADILKETLGRSTADPILDMTGRKLRTHHRRGGDGVHRACTCGCTEAIQAVFEAGEEVSRKDDIKGDLEDMVYFVHHHVDRINEYRRFADELTRFLQANKTSSPELGAYVDDLQQILQQIPQEYSVQQENMKSFAYADDLVRRTMALTDKKDTKNLQAYMELLKEWRGMGGAQDYVLAQCHTITRKLAQEAGYGCANEPKAVALAQEVRARARQCLRNPDGYEIWADY